MGENHFDENPMLLYGLNLLMAAVAYYLWSLALIKHRDHDSALAQAFGRDVKGKASLVLYTTGIALSLVQPWLGFTLYAGVALMWLIPDRRMHAAIILNPPVDRLQAC